MIDQLHLFRGPLRRVKTTSIQIGGGELKSDHRGLAFVGCTDGSSGLVEDTFYVPKLGVNLLSAKQLCKTGMKGTFDDHNIWIKDGVITMIHAQQNNGLYIVKHISKRYKGKALVANLSKDTAYPTSEGPVTC